MFYNLLKKRVLVSGDPSSFILRIQKDVLERQLFSLHSLYVGIKRNWASGTQVLFVRRDMFTGSGVIHKIIAIDQLQEDERKLCLENNWYAKISFAKVVLFEPAVSVQDTPISGQNPLMLHGANISRRELLEIEGLAPSKIIL